MFHTVTFLCLSFSGSSSWIAPRRVWKIAAVNSQHSSNVCFLQLVFFYLISSVTQLLVLNLLSPPTKRLPQNLPVHVAHWVKRWREPLTGKKQKEIERETPTGMFDQSQLPAKAMHSSGLNPQSLPADKCKLPLSHTHTQSHMYSIQSATDADT